MPPPKNKPPRIQIEDVWPQIDCGRYPVKRSVGDEVEVWATIFRDGHESLGAAVLHRAPGSATWHETPLRAAGNDRWTGSFRVDAPGRWEFTVQAWVDRFESFRDELRRKVEAGQTDLDSELQEGALLFGVEVLDVETALSSTGADRSETTRLLNDLGVDADRERARFGAWYELFPRSWGGFAGVEQALPELAKLGFDVVYLPPIHPIGVTNRKGRNNGPAAGPDDPGSPWAIGSGQGGHTAIDPGLGTIDDFARLVAAAGTHGLEIALDFAIQCSPDHPWLSEHPEWFHRRPDGTLKYAENPPKRYQDIYNVNFDSPDWQGLWAALLDVVLYWVGRGRAVLPGRQPAHEAARVLGVADPGGARGRPRRHLPVGGLHAAVDDGRARQGGLQPVLHVLHLEEHEGGADRVHDRAHAVRAAAVLPAELLREHARHPPRVPAAWRPSSVRGATRARRDAVAELGIYSGYEHVENVPARAGSEEYLDSEKYEVKRRSLDGPLLPLVGKLNAIRRENAALQRLEGLDFLETENDQLLAYLRRAGGNVLIVCVNLDPASVREGVAVVPASFGLPPAFSASELLAGEEFHWRLGRNFLRLEPGQSHILRVETR